MHSGSRPSHECEKPPCSQEKLANNQHEERDGQPLQAENGAPTSQPIVLTLVESATAESRAGGGLMDDTQTQDSAQNEQEDGTGYVTGYKLLAACVALNLSMFLIFLDNSILSTATPTITNEFHSTQDIGWYVSSYQLALSVLQPTTGKLFTYLPNKWTYTVSLFIFELGSLICALANSSNMLIGGRTVAGLGASGLFNGAITIISALVPLQRRPAVMGIMMGFAQLGLIGGPLIGGSLTQYTTWRWCFWINLPIGGLAILLLAVVHIPEQLPKAPMRQFLQSPGLVRKFDLAGASLLAPAVVMLLLALEFGGKAYPWSSATVIGLFCGAGVATALFLAWEHLVAGNDDAMLPLALFRARVFVAACLTNVCVFGCTFISAYFLPIYFQSIQGSSPFTSGVHLLPSILSQLVLSIVSGVAVSRLGYYLPWAVAAAVLMSVGSGLVSTWSIGTGAGQWIGYQILLGAGRGAILQMGMVAIQTVLPNSQIAVAMAVLTFTQGLGSSILITVANTIFDNSLASEIQSRAPGVSAGAVLAAGATAFRNVVPEEELPGVLEAYAISFDRVFYLMIGLAVVTFVTSWGLGWHDVRQKKGHKPKVVSVPPQGQAEKGGSNV